MDDRRRPALQRGLDATGDRGVAPALRSIWGIGIPAIFLHAAVDYPFARLGVAAWVFVLAGALDIKEESQ